MEHGFAHLRPRGQQVPWQRLRASFPGGTVRPVLPICLNQPAGLYWSDFERSVSKRVPCSTSRQLPIVFSLIALGLTASGISAADPTVFSVSTQASPAPYSSWQAQYFTDSQRNDLSISGWNADPDGDGISNGLEYLFNFNPIAGIFPAEAAAMPRVTPQQPSTNVITYRRRIGVGAKLLFSVSRPCAGGTTEISRCKSPHLGHNSRVSVAVAPTCAVNRPRELAIK